MNSRKVRLSSTVAAVALLCGAAAYTTGASHAGAAGLLPTTTTLTAAPTSSAANPVPFGQQVKLTANVGIILIGGALISPSGNISFSFVSNGITVSLGAARLSSCLLHFKSCTASLTTTLPPGTVTVTASYPGDPLAGSSAAHTQVTTAAEPPPSGTTQTGCSFQAECPFEDPNGNVNEAFDLFSPNDGSFYSATAGFVTAGLSCDDLSLGLDDVQFQLVGPPPFSQKLASLFVGGTAGAALNSEFGTIPPATNGSPICYQSDTDFLTFAGTPAKYSPATQAFTGLLPICTVVNSDSSGQAAPCVEDAFPSDGPYEIDMALPGGDPRLGPG